MLKINFEFNDDFARGEADAKSHEPHREGMSVQYDAGYGFQIQKANQADHRSEKQNVTFN